MTQASADKAILTCALTGVLTDTLISSIIELSVAVNNFACGTNMTPM